MPRHGVPTYPKKPHSSGQARVVIAGKTCYLGRFGSPESHEAYLRIVGQLEAGTAMPVRRHVATVADLVQHFRQHAERRYQGGELREYRIVGRLLHEACGDTLAKDFGPLAFKALRQRWIDAGLSRGVINQRCSRICRVFKLGVENEQVPETVHRALEKVTPLQYGEAREPAKVRPAPSGALAAIVPHLSPMFAAVAQLEALCGARGGELLLMRACDLDRSDDIWIFQPARHKTRHHGHARPIYLGPRCQAILAPWLKSSTEPQAYLFHAPKCPSKPASTSGYAHAITHACERAGVERFHAHQLRHSALTRVRHILSLDAAQIIGGHSSAQTTERYAAPDHAQGKEAARLLA